MFRKFREKLPMTPRLCESFLCNSSPGYALDDNRLRFRNFVLRISKKVNLGLQSNPLVWALPLQAVLLLSVLDLLDPWGDEWFTVTTAPKPISQVVSTVAANVHPPLYFVLLHYWIQFPWTLSPEAS